MYIFCAHVTVTVKFTKTIFEFMKFEIYEMIKPLANLNTATLQTHAFFVQNNVTLGLFSSSPTIIFAHKWRVQDRR